MAEPARRIRFLVSMGVLLGLSLACGAKPPIAQEQFAAPGSWQEMRYDDLGLRIRLPAEPTFQRRRSAAEDGGAMNVTTGVTLNYELALGFTVFEDRLGFVGHPMTGEGALVHVARRTRPDTQVDSEVRNERDLLYHGFPGREATLVNPDNGVLMRIRYFVGRRRAYAVFAAMNAADERRLRGYVDGYFESLRIARSDSPSPEGRGTLDTNAWQYAYPPEAAFAVEMPGRAGRTDAALRIRSNSYPTRSYTVTDGTHTYGVIETRFGDKPNRAVLDAIQANLTSAGLAVRRSRDVQVQGYAGRALVLESDTRVIHTRMYVTASRVYEVRVTLPRTAEAEAGESIERFVDSFRIL